MSAPQARAAWTLAPGAAPLVRSWDGEHVVYHPASGDTHLLDTAALRVLERVARGPADEAMLAALPDVGAQARALADDLAALGLLARAGV